MLLQRSALRLLRSVRAMPRVAWPRHPSSCSSKPRELPAPVRFAEVRRARSGVKQVPAAEFRSFAPGAMRTPGRHAGQRCSRPFMRETHVPSARSSDTPGKRGVRPFGVSCPPNAMRYTRPTSTQREAFRQRSAFLYPRGWGSR